MCVLSIPLSNSLTPDRGPTESTQRCHQIPQVKASPPHPHPTTSDDNLKSRLSSVLLTSYRQEVPKTPSLGSINLLEMLTELRENISLTRLPIYYKKSQLRNSQVEEAHRARYVGRGMELLYHLWVQHST